MRKEESREFTYWQPASLTSSILLLLLFGFFLITSIVVLFRTSSVDPKAVLMCYIAILLVGVLGFVFGYSLIVNVSLGLPAIITLVMGLSSLIWAKRQKEKKLILKSSVAIAIPLMVLCFIILSSLSLKLQLYRCRRYAGISLPSSTCVHFMQKCQHFVGSESEVYMKLTIDKADLPVFLRSKPFAIAIPENQIVPNNFHIDHSFLDAINALPFGWKPDVLKNCWGAEWRTNVYSSGDIFVDVADSKKAIVYLSVMYEPRVSVVE